MEKKSQKSDETKGPGTRARPLWTVAGAFWLIVLCLHAACATRAPMADPAGEADDAASGHEAATEPGLEGSIVLDVTIVEPGRVATRPVPISKAEFKEEVARLARGLQFHGTPQRMAAQLLEAQTLPGEEQGVRPVSDVTASGRYEAEVDPRANGGRGEVYSLLPMDRTGPVPLTPEAEAALRARYERFCLTRGGGDCLGLLEDGSYLRSDDRRTLALALAFGSVLDETYAALGREVSPQAILASVMWAVGTESYGAKVTAAINRMRRRGLLHRAELLERQARGRWVETELRLRFPQLKWNRRGVDVTGPSGQLYHYEILSGSESNFELHGRRMESTFFRMIFF